MAAGSPPGLLKLQKPIVAMASVTKMRKKAAVGQVQAVQTSNQWCLLPKPDRGRDPWRDVSGQVQTR